MVMSVKVDVKGFDTVMPKVRRGIKAGLLKTARRIERDSRINAPRDTGFLKASHRVRAVNDFLVIVEAFASYAEYMEKPGRVRREGRRPFMKPAMVKNTPFLSKDIAAEVKRRLA